MFAMFVTRHATHWNVDHNIHTHYHFHLISHSDLLQTLTQLGIHYVQVEDDKKIKKLL